MRRGLVGIALVLLSVGSALEAWAEVRAITGRNGEYRMTRVIASRMTPADGSVGEGSRVGPWRPFGRGAGPKTLNAEGDRKGDLWPTIAESRTSPYLPWVIWSRLNGSQYDLAWSRWLPEGGWQPVRWLATGEPGSGDDLDANVDFDARGRPYVAWWTDRGGRGTVYVSLFLQTEWMAPLVVSDRSADSRYPEIQVLDDGAVRVRYETAAGMVEQTVRFADPVTITDDINPLDFVSSGTTSVVEEGGDQTP